MFTWVLWFHRFRGTQPTTNSDDTFPTAYENNNIQPILCPYKETTTKNNQTQIQTTPYRSSSPSWPQPSSRRFVVPQRPCQFPPLHAKSERDQTWQWVLSHQGYLYCVPNSPYWLSPTPRDKREFQRSSSSKSDFIQNQGSLATLKNGMHIVYSTKWFLASTWRLRLHYPRRLVFSGFFGPRRFIRLGPLDNYHPSGQTSYKACNHLWL